ncbi:MAG: helix-turn-helix domain-containing protein, partial [Spirochaetota bacterium]
MLKDIGQTQPSKEALRKIICSVQDTKKSMPHISIGDICAIKNIPKATYYRYKKQFQAGGIQNLEPQSRAPKNRRT